MVTTGLHAFLEAPGKDPFPWLLKVTEFHFLWF